MVYEVRSSVPTASEAGRLIFVTAERGSLQRWNISE
jgi:hypothetical protein